MKFKRFIHTLIADPVIADKMIVLAGPRQVGKTTAAKDWLAHTGHEQLYFNWDNESTRRQFRRDPNFFESLARGAGENSRIVFDEIHKLRHWKTVLKGYYDTFGSDFNFLITGSARLELLQRAGDSMLGRYHLLHLAPLLANEIEERCSEPNTTLTIDETTLGNPPLAQETIEALVQFSGFPDPFLKASARSLHLWHQEYLQRIVREELRDLTNISDVNRAEHFIEMLPSRIGAPFSLNSIAGDVACSYDSARSLLKAFEKLSVITIVRPYSRRIQNALSKEPKVYLVDWTQVNDDGARFENFMAMQLQAFCDYVTDGGWAKIDLFYVRDKQKREVDFLLTIDGRPTLLIEAKQSEEQLDSNLLYFTERIPRTQGVQVVMKPGVFGKKGKIWIVSANRFLNALWEGGVTPQLHR